MAPLKTRGLSLPFVIRLEFYWRVAIKSVGVLVGKHNTTFGFCMACHQSFSLRGRSCNYIYNECIRLNFIACNQSASGELGFEIKNARTQVIEDCDE